MSEECVTAWELLEKQQTLEKVAAEKYPWNPDECTHHMAVERQLLYACQTCAAESGRPNAVCYSCSIRCHTDHDLVELFSKRNITCDCGTAQIGGGVCELRGIGELEKSDNTVYGHNFYNRFCECDSEYSEAEGGVMFQCLLGTECQEDWYHERCVLGLSKEEEAAIRGVLVKPEAEGVNLLDRLESAHAVEHSEASEEPEAAAEEEATLPGLPSMAAFDAFICWKCASKHNWDGLSCVRVERASAKREGQPAKRAKVVRASLFLPPGYEKQFKDLASSHENIAELVKKYPFLVDGEQTYEPAADDDASSSIFEAGERALRDLPREAAFNGIQAYSAMRDKLTEFLAPFASEGRVVTPADVTKFFSTL